MQLAGRDGNKLVWGPPRDIDAAIALLRDAVASGVRHGASILAVSRRCVSKAKARIVSASKSFRSNAHARYWPAPVHHQTVSPGGSVAGQQDTGDPCFGRRVAIVKCGITPQHEMAE